MRRAALLLPRINHIKISVSNNITLSPKFSHDLIDRLFISRQHAIKGVLFDGPKAFFINRNDNTLGTSAIKDLNAFPAVKGFYDIFHFITKVYDIGFDSGSLLFASLLCLHQVYIKDFHRQDQDLLFLKLHPHFHPDFGRGVFAFTVGVNRSP